MADIKVTPPDQLTELIIRNFEGLHNIADRVWLMDYDECKSFIVFWIAQSHTINGVNFEKAYDIAAAILARHKKYPEVRGEDPQSLADAVHRLSVENRSIFFEALIESDR